MALQRGPYGPVPAAPVVVLGAVGSVPGGLGVVEGGEIPYKPEMLARRRENQEKWLERDPEIKCYLPGVPRATYMPHPFQIFQSPSNIFITYEYAGAVRTIYMKDPGEPPVDSWMGQSSGRWDGDTLVVEARGFNDQTWFDRAGNFHSDALKITERYTRTGPDHLMYEATIETYPAVYVTQRREIEAQAVTAANHAFGSLLTDTRLNYDAASNTMTYRSMLVSQSNLPGAVATAVGIQMDSNSPIPKLRFEFILPNVEGTIADFAFVGLNVKIVVEMTPKPEQYDLTTQPKRVPQVVTVPQGPAGQPLVGPGVNWNYVIGGGLVLVATAIVVGTLIEDFFTAGAGVTDDPVSFALAAGSVARGLQLMRGGVVPAAAVPALVNLSLRLDTSTRPQGAIHPLR